jgi:zinc/manganese transport system permease protein
MRSWRLVLSQSCPGLSAFFSLCAAKLSPAMPLSHIGFAGATGAGLIGLAPIWGLLGFTLGAGIGMGLLGQRIAGRDVAIGVVLALALGFGLLFLHHYTFFANQATAILFGNVLAVDRSTIKIRAALAVVTLAALSAIMRPLPHFDHPGSVSDPAPELLARGQKRRGDPTRFLP